MVQIVDKYKRFTCNEKMLLLDMDGRFMDVHFIIFYTSLNIFLNHFIYLSQVISNILIKNRRILNITSENKWTQSVCEKMHLHGYAHLNTSSLRMPLCHFIFHGWKIVVSPLGRRANLG